MSPEEIARHALNSPYLDSNALTIYPDALNGVQTTRANDGTWITCQVLIPDDEAQRVQLEDPHFPKE